MTPLFNQSKLRKLQQEQQKRTSKSVESKQSSTSSKDDDKIYEIMSKRLKTDVAFLLLEEADRKERRMESLVRTYTERGETEKAKEWEDKLEAFCLANV